MAKALVCGGRDYADSARVFRVLDAAAERLGVDFIIQGGARGADYLAWQWADVRGVKVGTFNADWKAHGKQAGSIRNQQMLDEGRPDLVLAFPGGVGTNDMIRRAEASGLPVYRC